MKLYRTLLPAFALTLLPVLPLSAQTDEDDAVKASKATDDDIAQESQRVQATPAGTFSTKKRTVGKDGKITVHDTSTKLEVKYDDHGDAGAKKDLEEKQALIEKMQKANEEKQAAAGNDGDLPSKNDDIPTARKAGEEGAAPDEGTKVAKAEPVSAEDLDGATDVAVQQGNEAKKVKLTGEQKRLLEEQLRTKKQTEEELREQRAILDRTPETDKMKNPTLKKRGSFTR